MFPTPRTGASLVLSFRLATKAILIIGSGPLTASRAFAALEADASHVYILAKGGLRSASEEIQWRVSEGQLEFIDWDQLVDLDTWLAGRTDIALACITDTLLGSPLRARASTEELYTLLQKHRILVNTTDTPDLCNFSFTASHRFMDPTTGEPTPLQVGVTTNGEGCRLASRITREVVARLPKDVGCAVVSVGKMRRTAKLKAMDDNDADEVSAEDSGVLTPNRPVLSEDRRRLKWVAQVSEFWPLSKLATLSEAEMLELTADKPLNPPTIHSLSPTPKRGRIVLLGSGPGHPALLTVLTHQILTTHADLVLADKLVPQGVLDLIPTKTELVIAKKFPGNADRSQEEMMNLAVEGARKGLCVVRLKQGDPSIYGRSSEEVLFFRARGFEPLLVPGISSALAGPTFGGIALTHRGVAESVVVCTGVGRGGRGVQMPEYERGRTLVILMGVARLQGVVDALLGVSTLTTASSSASTTTTPHTTTPHTPTPYPPYLPIAIIERASMPDQRVTSATLATIVQALEAGGPQRPPGMIVIGWSVLGLWDDGKAGEGVLDDVVGEKEGEGARRDREERDEQRVKKWLGGEGWRVREGLDEGWAGLDAGWLDGVS